MFEGANYFAVFLPSLNLGSYKAGGQRGTNSRKQLIEQCNQGQKLREPVHDRLTHNFQFRVLLPSTGNRSLLPTPSVLLSHWWYRMLFLLQHHRLSLKDFFSVCGILIVWKNLCT